MVGLQDLMPSIYSVSSEITEERNLCDWMQEDSGWGEVDLADVWSCINHYFGTSISLEQWERFLGVRPDYDDEWLRQVKPQLTFGRLADLIAPHAEGVAFDPVEICLR